MRLTCKVMFIAGAGCGIGRAAGLFAREGAISWLGDVDPGAIEASGASAPERDLRVLPFDVKQAISVTGAVRPISRDCGCLDILCNKAGGPQRGDRLLSDCDHQVFWSTVAVSLFGVWLCCRHVVPLMLERGRGSIVNTASIVAMTGFARNPAYSAANGGVAALTRSMVASAPAGTELTRWRRAAGVPTGRAIRGVGTCLPRHAETVTCQEFSYARGSHSRRSSSHPPMPRA